MDVDEVPAPGNGTASAVSASSCRPADSCPVRRASARASIPAPVQSLTRGFQVWMRQVSLDSYWWNDDRLLDGHDVVYPVRDREAESVVMV